MPYIYLAPWEWSEGPLESLTYWRPPGGNALGALDLRSLPKQAIANDPTPGYGIFVYDRPQIIVGATGLGGDPQGQMSALQRSAIETELGIILASTRFTEIIEELFSTHADPAGQVATKPVRTGQRNGYEVYFGSFGRILQSRFSSSHPSFQGTIDVRWADYRAARTFAETLQGRARADYIDSLKRQTGYDMRKLYGRVGDDLFPGLVPPEYRLDGWLLPQTSITESFNKANADTLGPDLAWVEWDGDWDVVSNAAEVQSETGSQALARADSDLSSDDHFVKATMLNALGTDQKGLIARKESGNTTNTYYHVDARFSTGLWRTLRRVTGTYTAIGTNSTEAQADNDTIKLECNGSTIRRFKNDAEIDSATDTNITGFLQCGITADGGTNLHRLDVFEAEDLAAVASPKGPLGLPLYGPLGGPI